MDYNSLIQKAHFLEIKARSLAEGMKSGNFRSLYKGQGIEMESVRDYVRGDDIRAIDWNVTARMGKPFVKVFEEHRELQIFLIIDNSLSMQIKNEGVSKYDKAAETAALVSFAAEMNECPLGAVLFDGKINFAIPPKRGREQTMLLLSHLERNTNSRKTDNSAEFVQTNGSSLETALNGAGKQLKKRTFVIVISDFRTTGYEQALGRLAQKHDVVAIRIQDENDKALPELGSFYFIDAETGEKRMYPSSSQRFAKAWKNENNRRLQMWNDFCTKHGVFPEVMTIEQDPLRVLSEIFQKV